MGVLDVAGPGERVELPERYDDQHDERQQDQEEGLVLHDGLEGSIGALRPTTHMSEQGRVDDMADTTFDRSVSRTTSA